VEEVRDSRKVAVRDQAATNPCVLLNQPRHLPFRRFELVWIQALI
jgi:hypothetical protein